MTTMSPRKRVAAVVVAVLVAGACAGAIWAVANPSTPVESPYGEHAGPVPETAEPEDPEEEEAAAPPVSAAGCDAADATVADADELSDALAAAKPGTVITLAPGSYVGHFVATTNVNIRARPSTSGARVGQLSQGQAVKVGKYSGNWAWVQPYNGPAGYVSASYLARQ